MNVVLSGKIAPDELYDLAIEHGAAAAPGGAPAWPASRSSGGEQRRDPGPGRLYASCTAYGLSLAQIMNTIQRENVDSPGGNVDSTRRRSPYAPRASPRRRGHRQVRRGDDTRRGRCCMRDVAKIVVEQQARQPARSATPAASTRTDRRRGLVDHQAVRREHAGDGRRRADGAAPDADGRCPPGVDVTITNDTSRFVRHAVDAVQKDLILAIIITGVILFLFLHTWRSTLIVLVSIPTCLVSHLPG